LVDEMRQIRDRASPGTRCLEIACGSGWTMNAIRGAGFDYTGLDFSETALTIAMRRHPTGRFLNMAIDDLDLLGPRSFEFVYCSSMLEHLAEHNSALGRMMRWQAGTCSSCSMKGSARRPSTGFS